MSDVTVTCGSCGRPFVRQRMPRRLRLVDAEFVAEGDGGAFVHPVGVDCPLAAGASSDSQ